MDYEHSDPRNDGTEMTVNSLAFINPENGDAITYEGPFPFIRENGEWETAISADPDDYAGVPRETAEGLAQERPGHILSASADGRVVASGIILSADVLEGTLHISVDDPQRVTPDEIDMDLSEIERPDQDQDQEADQ